MTLFRLKYWPGHLAMVLCVAAAVGLGLWQLDAWQTRRADAARDISHEPAVALSSVITGDSSFPGRSLGRPVTFAGTWTADPTIYISDRYLNGRKGYWVVSPVRVDDSPSAMAVVRGWSAKPTSAKPTGPVAVTGWLQASEGSGPIDTDPSDDVLPMMRLASLVEHVQGDLYSGYVLAKGLSARAPDADTGAAGLTPVSTAAVPPVSGFTALRNFLYAVEWWVFGGFAFFVWVRWCRDSLEVLDPADVAEA